MQKLLTRAKTLQIPIWLAIILIAIVILRIPSLFEPYSYGDEMIYLTLGNAIRHGLILYKNIHDNKPPLLYDLAAIAENLFWFRAILGLWMMVTTILFWKLVKRLFPKNLDISTLATISFAALTTLPLLEGNIANAEAFMVGFSIIGFLFLLKQKPSNLDLILGGFAFSLATLFKVPAAFDFPVVIVYWFITKDKSWAELVKKIIIASLAFLIPIGLTFLWYFSKGALNQYLSAAFLQNVGYLSSWRPGSVEESFLTRNTPLIIRGLTVLVGIKLLWLFRKRLGSGFVFASIWLLFSLFAVTLSERPYPHYLIQSVPSIAILVGVLVFSKKMDQIWAILPLGLAVFVPVYYKFYYYDSISYYSRFVQFATGQISRETYFDRFDGNVNRNYQIAQFLQSSTSSTDTVFVWGDSPPIYALSRRLPTIRYVATYHINDFSTPEETISELKANMPDFVIILPGSPEFPQLNSFVKSNYLTIQTVAGVNIWHKTAPQILSRIY